MIDRKALLADLQKQVKALEKDLRGQAETATEITASNGAGAPARRVRERLHAEYDLAFKLGRTAATWAAWRDERVTQAAAAWVLGTVFVRFCEDNGLLTSPYLAGPSTERMVLAEEAQEEFFRVNPAETDRGWLLAAFGEIGGSQAGALLFDRKHNPLYQIPVSHDAAKELIAFWRRRGEDGRLVHDFVSDDWDTRFLGDLYQDLSEAARKTYALLQTPEFVEEFILDYTLTPAIAEFGQEELRMIDPTCGSGHFVLGAFHRLLAEWVRHAPTRDSRELVRLALKSVHGVDLNPFAIAIARFRLFIAALKASGFTTLDEGKPYEFPLNLAVGDSLLDYRQDVIPGLETSAEEFSYSTEDILNFEGILTYHNYHVVVGNPPYIKVRDAGLNSLYRRNYVSTYRSYHLSAPFTERFFRLAKNQRDDGRGSGYVGLIKDNAFMNAEFGKRLIETFLAHKVELTHIIDLSGIPISGHGTPTVILIGHPKDRNRALEIRVVSGVRGEPNASGDPSRGNVWQAILALIGDSGSRNDWIEVTDLPRSRLSKYPWILGASGTSNLVQLIEGASAGQLSARIEKPIGRAVRVGADDAFTRPFRATLHTRATPTLLKPLLSGGAIRDWAATPKEAIWYPYDPQVSHQLRDELWPWRRYLEERRTFQGNMADAGLTWWQYMQFTSSAYTSPLSIVFAFVQTHNHFSLDFGGKIFNRHSPAIKLPADASEEEHLELLAVLNSSTAGFWLKQVCKNKGVGGVGGGIGDEEWEPRYEFIGARVEELPIPGKMPGSTGKQIHLLAQQLTELDPTKSASTTAPTAEERNEAYRSWHMIRSRMIALQEELDWEVYSLYGLLDEELTAPGEVVPELRLGERAFEIVLARRMARGEVETQWFARHGSTPITELPEHWAPEYKAVVEKRIALIETDRNIGLIERPEYKRRWNTEGWDALQAKALRGWLLDRCEARELWFHDVDGIPDQPRMLSTAQLADLLRPDADFVSVADLYAPGKELDKVVAELVADDHVPYLAQLRYKDSGLDKRADWEDVWDRQRQEDAAQAVADTAKEAADQQRKIAEAAQKSGDEASAKQAFDEWAELDAKYRALEAEVERIRNAIPVPPKYASSDFLKNSYWRNRGKLDVAKERFISYPHASRDGDPTLLLGWAGWDHREQAQALATAIVDREQNHGWPADRLTPLLTGLREVLPWVRQWHDDFDPLYSGTPADIYEGFLNQTRDRLNLSDDDLTAWRPPKTARTRRSA
ncbi:BREX-2 system adenine-specific DNA-methyltransferase PglX [Sphaerisporangium sp. NPDC005288]|uniref:BREX-2 system adenine-specific DNA-methyltransferase PglX n=1 Tax=Sphaerisporangium sp. NPDC005288 TaxID=3155114 RepID=UPI0033A4C439